MAQCEISIEHSPPKKAGNEWTLKAEIEFIFIFMNNNRMRASFAAKIV